MAGKADMYGVKMIVEYDGTNYAGFQRQPSRPTIQGELEKALSIILREEIKVVGAGRTDAGVHALHQVVSFKTGASFEADRLQWSLNCLSPKDIAVKRIEIVDSSFCARRSATSREYEYFILNRSHPSPFLDRYSHFVARRLDLKAMREAAKFLVGTHDFFAFCPTCGGDPTRPETSSRRAPVRGRAVRTVFELTCRRTDKPVKGLLIIRIRANAFLHNMVRTIVGTLLEVGFGNFTPGVVKEILEGKERTKAGPTAPAKALFLTNISY